MTEIMIFNPTTSLKSLYTPLVWALQKSVEEEREQIKGFLKDALPSLETLEQKTKESMALYEISLHLKKLSVSLSQVCEGLILDDLPQNTEELLLELVADLKSLWTQEVMKEAKDKANIILKEIADKERQIKEAIIKRQKEIYDLAQKVALKAQRAHTRNSKTHS